MGDLKKILPLIIFGISFAFVEAVVVYYLRTLLGLHDGLVNKGSQILVDFKTIAFLKPNLNILSNPQITRVEMMREAATIIMLISVSYLVGRHFKQRLGAFLISFAVWDIFYYVFLKVLTGWPKSFSDSDVYFLIPVPWIGPVVTPIAISAILFIIGLKLFAVNNHNQHTFDPNH